MTEPRRTVLRGGAVHNPGRPAATALCVEDRSIRWVGDDAGAERYVDGASDVVELAGRLVTPAFVDAHVHTSQTGLRQTGLDLGTATSRLEMLDAVALHARGQANGVVLGFGWDETAWPEPHPPTATELDRAAPGRAVYLARVDMHSGLVSRTLLDHAPALTRAPGWSDTGRVERDAHHQARDAANALVSRGQRRDAIATALRSAGALGIGCVHEMAGPHVNAADDLVLITELSSELANERTTERALPEVVAYWGETAAAGGIERARELGCLGAAGDLCVDGAFGSHTAALRQPYADRPGHTGHLYLDAEQIADHVVACTRAGFQAGFHCIGDAATDAVVEGLRRAEQVLGTDALRTARLRLEHVELIDPAYLATLADLGVLACVQPAFDAAWGGTDGMYARRLGARRALATNPFAGFSGVNLALAFGSDSPVTPFDPWGAVRAAVHQHNEDQRIGVAEALDAHTRGGWYAARRDHAGVLTPGADATYAVWDLVPDRQPFDIPATAPACVRTVVAGKTVHDLEGGA